MSVVFVGALAGAFVAGGSLGAIGAWWAHRRTRLSAWNFYALAHQLALACDSHPLPAQALSRPLGSAGATERRPRHDARELELAQLTARTKRRQTKPPRH